MRHKNSFRGMNIYEHWGNLVGFHKPKGDLCDKRTPHTKTHLRNSELTR